MNTRKPLKGDVNKMKILINDQSDLDKYILNKKEYAFDLLIIDSNKDNTLVIPYVTNCVICLKNNSTVLVMDSDDTTKCTRIYANDDTVAIIKTENDLCVYGFNNSTIINRSENSNILECDLFDNAKFKDESLNQKLSRKMNLKVNDISTQERLDECVKLYWNYSKSRLDIDNSYLEPGSELIVNQKVKGRFELRGESRVVFKMPTNADNDSIDYDIIAYDKSTAILETNNCAFCSYNYVTIIKRCKDDIAYKYFSENSKLIDESLLLDTNKHKETSKGRCK
jgi:hypothetical protein